jgi:hypothetical protein
VSGFSLSGADSGNYTLIEPSGLTANISPANLAISGVTAADKVYDGTVAATLGGTATVTALGNDSVTIGGRGVGSFANKNVGSNKTVAVSGYTLSGVDAGNYALIGPTNLTANVTVRPLAINATGSNRTYDGLTDATVTLTDNRVAGDSLVVGYGAAAFSDVNVGTGKAVNVSGITLSGADAGNYTFSTSAATSANITAAALTVTANAASKVYDGIAFAGGNGVTYSGFVNNESASVLSGTLTYRGTSQRATNVGTYTIIPGGLSGNNYSITFVLNNLTVSQAPLTIIANDASKVVDGIAYIGGNGVTYSGFVASQSAAQLGGSLTYGGSSQGALAVGSYSIIPGGFTSTNYSITFQNGTLTIKPTALAISANQASKLLDATTYSDVAESQVDLSTSATL